MDHRNNEGHVGAGDADLWLMRYQEGSERAEGEDSRRESREASLLLMAWETQ